MDCMFSMHHISPYCVATTQSPVLTEILVLDLHLCRDQLGPFNETNSLESCIWLFYVVTMTIAETVFGSIATGLYMRNYRLRPLTLIHI